MKVPKYHMEDSFLSKEISMTISLSIFTHCDCVISEKILLKVFFVVGSPLLALTNGKMVRSMSDLTILLS